MEFTVTRRVLREGVRPGRVEIDRVQQDVRIVRIELVEDGRDLALGLVFHPVVDGGEIGARKISALYFVRIVSRKLSAIVADGLTSISALAMRNVAFDALASVTQRSPLRLASCGHGASLPFGRRRLAQPATQLEAVRTGRRAICQAAPPAPWHWRRRSPGRTAYAAAPGASPLRSRRARPASTIAIAVPIEVGDSTTLPGAAGERLNKSWPGLIVSLRERPAVALRPLPGSRPVPAPTPAASRSSACSVRQSLPSSAGPGVPGPNPLWPNRPGRETLREPGLVTRPLSHQ